MLAIEGMAILSTKADLLTTKRVYIITHSASLNAYNVIGTNTTTRAIEDSFTTSDVRKVFENIDGSSVGHIVHWIIRPRVF